METGQDSGSSVSLEDFVGQEFGDISHDSETPGSSDDGVAAGTPSQSTPPATPESTAGPEGTTDAERPGTPPEAAAAPSPDAGAPPVDADPFAGAKSSTYTVDGQERTYDGIKLLGEDFGNRAIIEPADLPDVMRRLGERDHLVAVNQQQYRERQALEPLTSWKTTGDDGKEQTLTGHAGLMAMHVEHARKDALIAVMDSVFQNPEALVSLLAKDEGGRLIVDPSALHDLTREIRLSAGEAATATKARLGSVVAEATKPVPPPLDLAATAPPFIRQLAGANASVLTPTDITFLAGQIKQYVHPGTTKVDESFQAVVSDRIALRQEMAKTAAVTATAAKANADKLAAAARGAKSIAPAKAPPKPPTQTEERATDADAAWDLMHNLAGARLKAAG